MLRRRSKRPKPGHPAATAREAKRDARSAAPSAPGTRRRARSDAYVAPELIIKHRVHETPAPAVRAPATAARVQPRSGEVVLVTGFEPFGGEKTNPSWEVCQELGDEIAGMRVETCRVPCEFRRSIEVAAEAIERLHPVLVVCLGLAGGRARIGVERVAINVDDARIPDNGGAQPVDGLIAANGPPAYFATLPIKAMAAAMRAAGAPAEVSNSAGTFVCNHLMYGVLHYLAASGHRARAGFIHVPYSEEQVLDKRDAPGMAVATMVKAIRAAIAAAREHRHDLKVSEGALA
jgi:pyroglutamyl-peptidase